MRKIKVLISNEFSKLGSGFATYMNDILHIIHADGRFEIAEQGSYLSPVHPLIDSVDWKVYPNEPHPADTAAVQKYKSDPQNQLGKMTFDDACLDFQPDIVCFVPGTLVATEFGHRPIEEIKVGDRVYTHKGRLRKVLKTYRKEYSGDVVEIQTNGINTSVKMTPEHPVLSYPENNTRATREAFLNTQKPTWRAANTLKPGNFVLLPKIEESGITEIKISDYVKDLEIRGDYVFPTNAQNGNLIKNVIPLNAEFGRFIGYYLGNGYSGEDCIEFTCHKDRIDDLKDIQRIVKNLFDIDITISEYKERLAVRTSINSVVVSKFVRSIVGHLCRHKYIPNIIMSGSDDLKKGVLEGWIKTDGCYRKTGITIGSRSLPMIMDGRLLALSLSIPSTIASYDQISKYSSGIFAELNFYGSTSRDVDSFVKKHENYEFRPTTAQPKTRIINGGLVKRISSVRTERYDGPVYNLEVEEDNSYVTNFIVHNCDIRDQWYVAHITNSHYRKNFKFIHLATVDGFPLSGKWFDTFYDADLLMTYSNFGKNVLEYQTAGKLKIFDVIPPPVDINVFRPGRRDELRQKFGLDSSMFLLGTTMRNQPRKLFPELLRAFALYLERCQTSGRHDLARNSYMFWHTTNPDLGWDIPTELRLHNLSHKVFFTYVCDKCKHIQITHWAGEKCFCQRCRDNTARLPNPALGVNRETIAEVSAISNLYIQYATNGGWEMGINEAKACGVPALIVPYSAMAEQCYNGGGIALKVLCLPQEPVTNTNQLRAMPDNSYTAEMIYNFVTDTEENKAKLAREARLCTEILYSPEVTAQKWINALLSVKIPDQSETWRRPLNLLRPNLNIPQNLSNRQFVMWMYHHVIYRPELANSAHAEKLIAILDSGYEQGVSDRETPTRIPVDRNNMAGYFLNMANEYNAKERIRYAKMFPELQPKIRAVTV